MRRLLSEIQSFSYYLKKILFLRIKGSLSLIGYTKNHPIYTSIFEENPPEGYLFYYFKPGIKSNTLLKYLKKNTNILHLDAASSALIKDENKKIVIECEGRSCSSYFNNKTINHLFVESEWAGGNFVKEENVTLLYPAININTVQKTKDVNTDKITLCAVGHGGMIKGFDVVVKLFYDLKKDYNLKLILAGSFGHNFEYYPEISREAYEKADFKHLSGELINDPDVEFKPFKRKDLFKEVYPKVDIYIHLSRLETFGYSILEAMSFGLPVIASKLHAIPEMVQDKYNGILVDAFEHDINSSEWFQNMFVQSKKAIIKLIESPGLRRQFGENSMNIVRKKFDIEQKRKILRDCYNNL